MLVKEIMRDDVIILYPHATFLDAATLFLRHEMSAAPVVNEEGKLIGILSEKDLLRAMYPSYSDITQSNQWQEVTPLAEKKTVTDIMSRRLISARPEQSVLTVGGLMVATGIHHVPVVNEVNDVIGMISRGDIYRAILKEKFHVYPLPHAT